MSVAYQGGIRGIRMLAGVFSLVVAGFFAWTTQVHAQDTSTGQRTVVGERYVPTIWVDPDGCEHWVMDDGFEGYLSQRLDRNGKPVCSGVAPPGTATGPFKKGSSIEDLI